jgi:hypothetical protein
MATPDSISQLLKEGETYRLTEFSKQVKSSFSILDKAIQKFNEAIIRLGSADTKTAAQTNQLAFAHSHLAATKFQKALDLPGIQPKDQIELLNESVNDFDEAIKIKGLNPWALAHRGQAYLYWALVVLEQTESSELVKKATASCQQAIDQSQGKYPWASAQLGLAHLWSSRRQTTGSAEWEKSLQSAEDSLTQAVKLSPDYAWAWALRNVVRERLGTPKQDFTLLKGAWDDLMMAIDLNPAIVYSFNTVTRVGGGSRVWAEAQLKQDLTNPLAQYIFALTKAESEGLGAAQKVITIERGVEGAASLSDFGI